MARRELIERSDPTSVFASLYSQPSQVADQYAFIPREAVSRFLLHCTECQRKPAGMVNNFDIKSEPSEFETKPTTPQLATPPATPPSEATGYNSLPYMLPPHGPIGPHAALAYAQVKSLLVAVLFLPDSYPVEDNRLGIPFSSFRRSMLCSLLLQGPSTRRTHPFLIQVCLSSSRCGVVEFCWALLGMLDRKKSFDMCSCKIFFQRLSL